VEVEDAAAEAVEEDGGDNTDPHPVTAFSTLHNIRKDLPTKRSQYNICSVIMIFNRK